MGPFLLFHDLKSFLVSSFPLETISNNIYTHTIVQNYITSVGYYHSKLYYLINFIPYGKGFKKYIITQNLSH